MKRYPAELKKELTKERTTVQKIIMELLQTKNVFFSINDILKYIYDSHKRIVKRRQATHALKKLIERGLVEREYNKSGTYKMVKTKKRKKIKNNKKKGNLLTK